MNQNEIREALIQYYIEEYKEANKYINRHKEDFSDEHISHYISSTVSEIYGATMFAVTQLHTNSASIFEVYNEYRDKILDLFYTL